jgi:signal transduction histidine kinase/ligand-binding sensor domain-containing protein
MLLCGACFTQAVEPSTLLANYARQTWAMENGLPQNTVQALTQTQDGFIWLGTEAGLVRFDGVAFQVFDRTSSPALPSGDIRCLLAAGDGTLWIGTSAGLAQWKNGSVRVFTTADGLPANGILSLVTVESGAVGAWTERGPAQQVGDRFGAVSNVDGFPHTALPSPGEYPGATVFEEELPGGILVMGNRNSLDFLRGKERPRSVLHLSTGQELPGSRIQVVFADREGALWIGTNAGLVRWVRGKIERFPVTDAIATASILAMMEDREGNLWVGTETDGLHILRDQRFHTLDTREGLSSDRVATVVEDQSGALWAGTQENGVNELHRDAATGNWRVSRTLSVAEGLASNVILSLAAAPSGDLWVGTPDGLNRIRGNRVNTYTSADGLPDDFIRSLLIDADGSLWIGTRRGLTHWSAGNVGFSKARAAAHMETYTQASGLGSDLVGAMARDAKGDLWVATLAGLSRLHGNTISNFTTADGLSSNVVTALLPRADGTLLIGTQDHGWNLWDGRKFSMDLQDGLEQTSIHAILDDGQGHLWFATGDGIARCDCTAMERMGSTPSYSRWLAFGMADGLPSRETATNSHPSAWRARDGHLWFTTPRGLVEVDPAHFPVNSLPPPVALERFQVDDVSESLSGLASWLKVQAGHVHFQFDYAGLSFVAPQKVRYRYMLEGFDHGWTDAGTRRSAYYTNIPPGRYTFRVQAANNDGLWNTTGAALSFELRPHFYQTFWFYALMLAAVAGMVVFFLRQRLHAAQREFKAVLGERSRIAREIHDTLAQGYVGVSVQLEVLAELLRQRKDSDAAKQLDKTREYVRHGLDDARQSIWALRTQDSSEVTLPVRVRRLVEAAQGSGLETRFSTFGAYRPLPAQTEQELLRIAQEAIHNVKMHAEASELFVQLEYEPETISLEVRDNGRGGAQDRTTETLPGHFGLTGIRERAEAIGGTLEVTSVPGAGTTIRLCAPAQGETSEETEVHA